MHIYAHFSVIASISPPFPSVWLTWIAVRAGIRTCHRNARPTCSASWLPRNSNDYTSLADDGRPSTILRKGFESARSPTRRQRIPPALPPDVWCHREFYLFWSLLVEHCHSVGFGPSVMISHSTTSTQYMPKSVFTVSLDSPHLFELKPAYRHIEFIVQIEIERSIDFLEKNRATFTPYECYHLDALIDKYESKKTSQTRQELKTVLIFMRRCVHLLPQI
uniref:Uncharacterized protein n=1 Tax=Panagrellus redivivus TaxID=6233 RepID=A0A7E4UWS1_PANRE